VGLLAREAFLFLLLPLVPLAGLFLFLLLAALPLAALVLDLLPRGALLLELPPLGIDLLDEGAVLLVHHVAEREREERALGLLAQPFDDPVAHGMARGVVESGQAARIGHHHARERDLPRRARGVRERHDEEILLVSEIVLRAAEAGESLGEELVEEREVLLPELEGLLERDDAVPEHLGHSH